MMAMPILRVMAWAIVGMFGVVRRLRNLIGMLVVDDLCLLDVDYLDYLVPTTWCRRNLVGTLVVDCPRLLCLAYLVLTKVQHLA